MKRRVDDARRDTIGDQRSQGRLPGAACNFHPIALIDAALLGVMRMDFETVLFVPDDIRGAARLGSDIIMAEDAPGREQERITRPASFVGRHIFGEDELALAFLEAADMHDRRAFRRLLIAGPLDRANFIELSEGDAREAWCRCRDLIHDLARMAVVHRHAHGFGELHRDLPIAKAVLGAHDLAHTPDAPLGVGEGSILFEEGRTRQEDMRVICRLIEEEILDDHAFHRGKASCHMVGVGVGLEDVLALDVNGL